MPSDRGAAAESRPAVSPIGAEESAAVAAYLHRALNRRVPIDAWQALIAPPWGRCGPNSGFVLRHGTEIVGAYVAVYSERAVDGSIIPVCNLAAFCVDEGYRAHGLRLVRSLISQEGFDFTDLSPSGNVIAMNERLGFRRIEGSTRLCVNLGAAQSRGTIVTDDPAQLERVLRGRDSRVYADHAAAAAARHLVVRRGDEYAYLVYRRDRRKRLPVFATPLYRGGSVDLLRRSWPAVGAALLRRGHLATLAEERILGFTPRGLVWRLSRPRPRMVRGDRIARQEIDYLYSELALLEW